MKDSTAKTRIKRAVNKALPTEPQPVKDYIEELTFITWEANRVDSYTFRNDTEALEDAININLDYELSEVLKEARTETAKGWRKGA